MKESIAPQAAILLDFIAGPESKGNYNAYFGNVNNTMPQAKTLGGILAWQKAYVAKGNKSSAYGRYQFMPPTLRDLGLKYDIKDDEPFTNDFQDELAYYLLIRRGYEKWMVGDLTDSAFADNLSKEWASLPYNTGRSFYAGDGLNKSLVTRAELMGVIKKAKGAKASAPEAPTAQAPDLEKLMGALLGTVASLIEGTAGKANILLTVAQWAPGLISGVFKSVDEVERGVSALAQLAENVRAGKWDQVEGNVEQVLKEFRQIMENFGIDHDALNVATTKLADVDSVATLKAKA